MYMNTHGNFVYVYVKCSMAAKKALEIEVEVELEFLADVFVLVRVRGRSAVVLVDVVVLPTQVLVLFLVQVHALVFHFNTSFAQTTTAVVISLVDGHKPVQRPLTKFNIAVLGPGPNAMGRFFFNIGRVRVKY